MKIKLNRTFLKILLVIIFMGKLSFSSVFAQQFDFDNQLLWQISGKGIKKPSYLFGSYHSNDNRLFEFSDSTFSALYNAEAVVLEADIYSMFTTLDPRMEIMVLDVDGVGKPYTSNKEASLTKYGSEDGRPQFLDAYFQQVAYNSGKQFFPLETLEDQLQAYENITYDNYKNISLNTFSLTKERVLQTYLSGDIESMRQLLKTQLAISANAYNLLISNRNEVMAKGIDSLCRKLSLFVAVGAAHLSGQDGIIQLLKNKGYTVRSVTATYAEKPTVAEISLRKFHQFKYVNESKRFSATFGGKPKVDSTLQHFKLTYQEMGQGNTYLVEISDDYEQFELSSRLLELFNTENPKAIKEINLPRNVQAYEGIVSIYGIGDCWRRVFMYKDQLFKITCYGGNKFMNSNRYKTFFDRVILLD